jgi:yeast amino acid transporter
MVNTNEFFPATYPVAGAFYDYSVRFVSEAWGFAMGWNFVFNWLIVLPFELVTIGSQLKFWKEDLNPGYFIAPFLVVLAFTSIMGSKWFGEMEHAFGIGKAVAISTFIVMAVIVAAGGVPSDPRYFPRYESLVQSWPSTDNHRGVIGFKYWTDPGAFQNGFRGFIMVFRVAGMSFGGTELLGLTAAECRDPQTSLPVATKIVFFRIAAFYVGALFMLGLVVPSNSPDLASTGHGAKESPFALAAKIANIPGLPHFFMAMVVVALISMANASIFSASRAIQALCEKGMGPRWGAKIRRSVPIYALLVTFVFGLLGFINCAPGGDSVFDWLLSLSSASNYYTWASICLSHIRFRKASQHQGRDLAELLWKSPFGVYGSWFGIMVCVIGLTANIWSAIFPVGGTYDVLSITRDNIGVCISPMFYLGYLLYQKYRHGIRKPWLIASETADIQTGRRDNTTLPPFPAMAAGEISSEK